MTAIELVAKALTKSVEAEPLPCDPADGVCCVTGIEGPAIPRKGLIGASFTDQEALKRPDSKSVSVDAYITLKHKWQRMSSWYCDGERFQRLDRLGVRSLVINGVNAPIWAGYATTSYKKHGALRAAVGGGSKQIWRFEGINVDVSDRERVLEVWRTLNRFLLLGIGRPSLEAGRCAPVAVRIAGVAAAMEFEQWAGPIYRSSIYQFLCYLLPSQEELKSINNKEKEEKCSVPSELNLF